MRLQGFRSDTDLSTKRSEFEVFVGTASPEGSVTASPGDYYLQTSPGAAWIKETGTGNTGWSKLGSTPAKSTYTIANNQSSAQNLTGFTIDETEIVYAKYIARVQRSTTTNEVAGAFELFAVWTGTEWRLDFTSAADDSGVEFSITAGGQVQYISSDLAGSSYAGSVEVVLASSVEA